MCICVNGSKKVKRLISGHRRLAADMHRYGLFAYFAKERDAEIWQHLSAVVEFCLCTVSELKLSIFIRGVIRIN